MSHWNYRVGKRTTTYEVVSDNDYSKVIDELSEDQYGIVECYYNEDGDIQFTSAEFQAPTGETYEELISDLELMLSDAKGKPVLDLDKLWKKIWRMLTKVNK